MNWSFWIPLLLPISSLATALLILPFREAQKTPRTIVNMAGATVKLLLVGIAGYGVYTGKVYEARLPLFTNLDLTFRVDDISLLFLVLSSVLWFLTSLYAIGYLERAPHRKRFFVFFSLCVTATMGIATAGNLITFLIFYEMLTLVTYPLIVHRGTEKALHAGRVYLRYTLVGGALLLLGVAWIHAIVGPTEFTHGGVMGALGGGYRKQLIAIFTLMIAGLGVKAALVPLHGWLPTAMIAPAPVSALLHAVAVVKAGVFGIIRLIYDIFGTTLANSLGLLVPLALIASFTIIYASIRALFQNDLKRRLAYSTVSQLSYIILGTSIWGPIGTIGALTHLVHQGIMKVTLFYCAGNLAEALGIHRVDELDGVGRSMPLTMGAFTIAAFGMIGAPPVAGVVTKWYLGLGAIQSHEYWVIGVLGASSLLNAAYFLPLVYAAWFKEPKVKSIVDGLKGKWAEPSSMLLVPTLITALFSLLAGICAGSDFSPLGAAKLITERMYSK